MNRRGFALLTTLWVSVLLAATAATVVEAARLASHAALNRWTMNRGRWARAACGEILAARLAEGPSVARLDTVDLGQGAWCTATVTAADWLIDLNRAPASRLRLLLGADSLVEALRDWTDPDTLTPAGVAENDWYRGRHRVTPPNRPLAAVDELRLVRGFDAALVERVRRQAWTGDVAASPACPVADRCAASTLVVSLAGGIRGRPVVARGRLVVRRAGGRLAVLLQEVQ